MCAPEYGFVSADREFDGEWVEWVEYEEFRDVEAALQIEQIKGILRMSEDDAAPHYKLKLISDIIG